MNSSSLKRLLIIFFAFVATAQASRHWVTLNDCRYLPNPANDGDSFHVRAGKKEYILRLYFVDAPETDTSLPERVAEQAKYFRLTVPQTLQIGIEAERFTRQKLSHPFTVRTCKQDARGRSRLPRYFAFVQTETADLGEELVANGLARVYGAASEAPGMNAPKVEWRRLEQLERKAKEQMIGAWGIGAGRLSTRAAVQPSASADSFDAFFQPTAKLVATSAGEMPGSGAKLDINSASSAALESLPGVGPVLATRIIATRPFKNADELQNVQGIGAKRYGQLRPYFK